MAEKPIIFFGPMVRAILAGRKTQTRRVVKPQPKFHADGNPGWYPSGDARRRMHYATVEHLVRGMPADFCPFGQPGSRLWVRETGWERPVRTPRMMREGADTWERFYYDADGLSEGDHEQFKAWGFTRRPSTCMPRWASRIDLEITDVRVERLNEISPDDAIAEGLLGLTKDGNMVKYGIPDKDGLPGTDDTGWPWHEWRISPVDAYQKLWQSIHGPDSWAANPWVWVIEFRRINNG